MGASNKTPADTVTRRDLARLLAQHPDSLTRSLPAGLGAAVVRWGGRGKETIFDRDQALRWAAAWRCRQARGRRECA